MSKVNVEKVGSQDDRKLPIFDEIKELSDRIRVRAFKLFSKRGYSDGGDMDDWLTAEREICWPTAELVEKDDEYEVHVALAGFEADDITVTATPNELIIKASREDKRKKTEKKEGVKIRWSEFQGNEVYRQIALPNAIDVAGIEAEFEKGMLEIEAPKLRNKSRSSRAKKIKVSSSDA